MQRLFRYRYPKLTLLGIMVILAYCLFSNEAFGDFILSLNGYAYFGMFIAGILFSLGFTAPFAVGFFILFNPDNLILAALVGGFGAFISDFLLFKLIRFSFMDEFRRLERTEPLKELIKLAEKDLSVRARHYLLYAFAGIIIASPLPNEIGITMLAGLSHIKPKIFAIISFTMNTLGILLMLCI